MLIKWVYFFWIVTIWSAFLNLANYFETNDINCYMTVEDYIESQLFDRVETLYLLRDLITNVIPNCVESTKYNMPTYGLDGEIIVAFASQKHHMALYLCHYDLMAKFKEELSRFNCGKSCIRFKSLKEKDIDLFSKILEYFSKHIKNSKFYGKYPMG